MKRKKSIKLFCIVFILAFAFAVQSTAMASDPINVNTATVKELVSLKGIGKKLAERIVQYRQKNGTFKTVEDLLKVKGIGPKLLDKNKGKMTV